MNVLNLCAHWCASGWPMWQTLSWRDGADLVINTREFVVNTGQALMRSALLCWGNNGGWCVLLGNALAIATASSLWRIKQLWGQNTAGHDRHMPITMDESGRHDHDSHYDSCLEGGVLWG